jgi:hypothetical protein
VSERAKFLLDWERRWQVGHVNVAELCRQYGGEPAEMSVH